MRSSEEVPEVVLPGDEEKDNSIQKNPTTFEDDESPKSPPSQTLRQEIKEMERTEDESNLYSIHKPR